MYIIFLNPNSLEQISLVNIYSLLTSYDKEDWRKLQLFLQQLGEHAVVSVVALYNSLFLSSPWLKSESAHPLVEFLCDYGFEWSKQVCVSAYLEDLRKQDAYLVALRLSLSTVTFAAYHLMWFGFFFACFPEESRSNDSSESVYGFI